MKKSISKLCLIAVLPCLAGCAIFPDDTPYKTRSCAQLQNSYFAYNASAKRSQAGASNKAGDIFSLIFRDEKEKKANSARKVYTAKCAPKS